MSSKYDIPNIPEQVYKVSWEESGAFGLYSRNNNYFEKSEDAISLMKTQSERTLGSVELSLTPTSLMRLSEIREIN